MKTVTKYYDSKFRLRILGKGKKADSSMIRFKILGNGKIFPCCDFEGKCTNFAYAEVFPSLMKGSKKKGWGYLCRKHYYEEQRRLGWKLPSCLTVE